MRAVFCPSCHSTNIIAYAGGITGIYKCLDCGYIGGIIIEKDFIKKTQEDEEESL